MTKLHNNIKKSLSLTVAISVFLVSLFTGVVFNVEAADSGVIDLLEYSSDGKTPLPGSTSPWWDDNLADNGETGDTWEDAIIIDSAEELVYLCKAANSDTIGKHYKVADGIKGFNFSTKTLDLNGTYEENESIITGSQKNHAGTTGNFQGHFDGNGAIVYGIWTKQSNENAGLFHKASGNVTIKNIGVSLSYITASKHAGGILGHYVGDGTSALVIENCSVTNSHIEVTSVSTTYLYTSVGAIYGYAKNWATGVAGVVSVNNCYVNLNEDHFVSQIEQTQADNSLKGGHGGLGGIAATGNASFSNCVVIGITPYTTTSAEEYGEIRDTALAKYFTNIYTDAPSGKVNVGGNYGVIDYTGKIFSLTTDQMKGGNAFGNMDLDWSKWYVTQDGYPQLRVFNPEAKFIAAACVGEIDLLEYSSDGKTPLPGSTSPWWDDCLADNAETGDDWENAIIIDSAEELVYLCKGANSETKNKYYKVADGIKGFNLSKNTLKINGTYEENESIITTSNKNHAGGTGNFQGHFDGNGAVVYGACCSSISEYAGLFHKASGNVTIKNIGISLSYIIATKQAGGIVGRYKGSSAGDSLVIDNCSVTESHIEITTGGYYSGIGAILGYGEDNTTNSSTIVRNCYVNLDQKHMVCLNDSKSDGYTYCIHGGLSGCIRNANNTFSNCVVIGINPYSTTHLKSNDVYYVSNPANYSQIYTNIAIADKVVIGTNNANTYSYTGKIFSLTTDQMKGENAINNMNNFDWSQWFVTDEGYPELKSFHGDEFICSFDAEDKYSGHKTYCVSCRVASVVQNHDYVVTGQGNDASAKCEDCGFVCDHNGEGHYTYTESEADCTTKPTFTKVCDCGVTITGVSSETGASHIPSGNYYIAENTHCDICENCGEIFDETQHSDSDNNNACDTCGWIYVEGERVFDGASITLTESIAVNYIINASVVERLGYSDLYLSFVFYGKEYIVDDYSVNGNYYIFTFDKIAPHVMSETIYATLCGTKDGVDYKSKTSEYSIEQYCLNMLKKYGSDKELCTLLVDLVNYGANAQEYTNYKTDKPANSKLSEDQLAIGTRGSVPVVSVQNLKYVTIPTPSVKWKGAGLYLDEEATLRFKIQTDDVSNLVVKAVCSVNTIEIPSSKFVKCGDNLYYVYVRGINATQMRDPIDLTVFADDTVVSNTIRYSIESYVSNIINGTDSLSKLLTAMMKYGDSAKAYESRNCNHVYNETTQKEAKLFDAGINTYTCSVCGYSYRKAVPVNKIKILSIGNSYSRDSMRQLYDVLTSAGIEEVDIVSMYIGGCSLDKHWENATTGGANYTIFRSNNQSSEWTESTTKYSIKTLLDEGDWDVISLQHSPEGAATLSKFTNLGNMIDYVSGKCPNAEIVWFMTWAFQEGSEYLGSNYDYSAENMFGKIIDCTQTNVAPYINSGDLHSIVPVGTAVMNARTSRIRDGMHRADKSHLSYELGDYVAALTWFGHLTGMSPYDVEFVAEHSIANENIDIIYESAENALEYPYEITKSYYK